MSQAQTKVCRKCEIEKPISEFHNKKDGRLGCASSCKLCENSRRREAPRDPQAKKERDRAWRENNPEKVKASAKKWRENNREKKREDDARWRRENPEKAKAKARRASAKLRSTPSGRIGDAVSVAVRSAITKSAKRGRKTFSLLGYTVEELMRHLEKHFQPGMTWENYGRGGWNIDHEIPQSAFFFDAPDQIDFRKCWSLSNLRPMWERENFAKGAKLASRFQPSLPIAANDNAPAKESE